MSGALECGASWLVVCATCKPEVAGSIAGWAEFAVDAVVLGKAFTHICTLLTQE